jgi:hypothetical protein
MTKRIISLASTNASVSYYTNTRRAMADHSRKRRRNNAYKVGLSLVCVLSTFQNRKAAAWLSPTSPRFNPRAGFVSRLLLSQKPAGICRQLYLVDDGNYGNGTHLDYNNNNNNNTTGGIMEEQDNDPKSMNNSSNIQGNAGNFGDIMSPKSNDADVLFRDGLVTSNSYSIAEVYGIQNPLDRIAVTANGNLQRLFSSFYDAPVNVVVEYCTKATEEGEWNRRVGLVIFEDQVFCTADSKVQIHNPEWIGLIESGKLGLGQLFRYHNVLPEFILQSAGPTNEGGFWRNYTLECPFMTCHIHEVFCPGVWELTPRDMR